MAPTHKMLLLPFLLILPTLALSQQDYIEEPNPLTLNKRTLLIPQHRPSSIYSKWKYLSRGRNSELSSEELSGSSEHNQASQPQQQPIPFIPISNSEENLSEPAVAGVAADAVSSDSGSIEETPIRQQNQKGEVGQVTRRRQAGFLPSSSSEEEEEEQQYEDEEYGAPNDLITFSYYPISQRHDNTGGLIYKIEDSVLRTSRAGGGWGKGKKKKCKKGKKKKGKKKKGKKKKGCSIKGGWWYAFDKKHGYIAGRWGDPPPKGLEKEHYHHNFGKYGHSYGQGYDGHGHMGWKVKGWHGGHGGYGGGGYGGFNGFGGGGIGGGGFGGGTHGHHHHHHAHHGWHPVEYYGWGWAEKQKGWGWKR